MDSETAKTMLEALETLKQRRSKLTYPLSAFGVNTLIESIDLLTTVCVAILEAAATEQR